MKKMMLVGETNSGKSSLIKTLTEGKYSPRRAMAVEYCGQFINTPGEFLENSRFYHALITSSADCQVLALIQDATRRTSLFPPLFASMFNRKVIGVISKIDDDKADPKLASRFLAQAGTQEIIHTSSITSQGIETLLKLIESK